MAYDDISSVLREVRSIVSHKYKSLLLVLVFTVLVPLFCDVFLNKTVLGDLHILQEQLLHLKDETTKVDFDTSLLYKTMILACLNVIIIIVVDTFIVITAIYIVLSTSDDLFDIKRNFFMRLLKQTFFNVFKIFCVLYFVLFLSAMLHIIAQLSNNTIVQLLKFLMVNFVAIYTTITLFAPLNAAGEGNTITQAFRGSFYLVRQNLGLSVKLSCIYLLLSFVFSLNITLMSILLPTLKILLYICIALIYFDDMKCRINTNANA